uniref:UBX domain-containing protein n=1 Tax=Chrysotila carterae TaxID=13221 RepID=A0A7S4BTG8_CHRCT|mmetsp:Transcript_14611/g.28551  ORF Transcript_14611/g.28551 Transcript_14611/m.28551 type:complete len:434 (+) Transcript_14611:194-1495(+)
MMDVDLEFASRRFKNEQSSRQRAAAERREALRKEREVSRLQRAAREAEIAQREAEAARAAEESARMREADLEKNRGIVYHARLQPRLCMDAEVKGVRRRADKVTLPRSAAAELAHAYKNGQLFFELSAGNGRPVTHVSILDFTADEGTIGMPPEVLRCLGLATDGSSGHHVMVRYKLLKRGTFARVQPVKRRFRTEVADVKLFLEHELHLRTTLSEGDELEVGTGAERHVLRILELKPESAVSLIDTDLEVEVNASVEEEEEVAAAEAERRRAEAAAAAFAAEQEAKRAAAAAAAAAAEREAEEREKAAAAAAREEREGRRREAAAVLQSGSLASASGGSGGGEVKVVVRCPDGSRCSGTFARTAPLALLFALVEAEWVEALGAPLLPQEFRLAASYPRRAFDRAQAQAATLESAGLGSAQEALFVEIPGVQA